MVKDEELPAGRPLDARVAEVIFGGRAHQPQWYWSRRRSLDTEADLYAGPRFSTDLTAAWELIDRLLASGASTGSAWKVHLDLEAGKARCAISTAAGAQVEASAETVSLAICRAVLKAAVAGPSRATTPVERGDADASAGASSRATGALEEAPAATGPDAAGKSDELQPAGV